MPAFGHYWFRKRFSTDQTAKRNLLFFLLRFTGTFMTSGYWVDSQLIELPSSQIISTIMQEFARISITTESSLYSRHESSCQLRSALGMRTLWLLTLIVLTYIRLVVHDGNTSNIGASFLWSSLQLATHLSHPLVFLDKIGITP
jgi:hypothetical protein